MSEAEKEEALSYLNTAIGLALRADHPYQSRWIYGEEDTPWELGEEPDYATMASELRIKILSQIPDRQEELNEAMQQYLDCKERGAQIRLKDIKKEKNQEEYEWEKEYYTELLKYDIPNDRMKLVDIRQWTGTGKTSFMHERWERNQGEGVEVKCSSQHVIDIDASSWATTQAIQSIQRTLNGVVVFVPVGTTVVSTHGGYFYPDVLLKAEGETYSDRGALQAEVTFVAV